MRIPGPVYGAQIQAHCPGSIPKIDAFILEVMQLSAGVVVMAGSECRMNDTLHVTGGGAAPANGMGVQDKNVPCGGGWLIEATVQFAWGWVFLCWAGTTTNTDSLFCCQAYNTMLLLYTYLPITVLHSPDRSRPCAMAEAHLQCIQSCACKLSWLILVAIRLSTVSVVFFLRSVSCNKILH